MKTIWDNDEQPTFIVISEDAWRTFHRDGTGQSYIPVSCIEVVLGTDGYHYLMPRMLGRVSGNSLEESLCYYPRKGD